jgi:hypothetical protein
MKVYKIHLLPATVGLLFFALLLQTGCGIAPRGSASREGSASSVPSREQQDAEQCITNLAWIDAAKEQWAAQHDKQDGDPIKKGGVDLYMKQGGPKCPAGGTYTYGNAGELPKCSVPGHVLSYSE